MRRKHRRGLLAVKFLPGIGSLFRLQRTHQRTAPIHAQNRLFNRIFPSSLVFTLLPFTHPHPFGPGTSLTVIGLRPDKGHHQHDSHNGYQSSQQNKLSGIHSNRSFIATSGLYILDNTIIVQKERGQYKSTFSASIVSSFPARKTLIYLNVNRACLLPPTPKFMTFCPCKPDACLSYHV